MSLEQALNDNTAMMAALIAALQEAARSAGCEGSDTAVLGARMTATEVNASQKQAIKAADAAAKTPVKPEPKELKPEVPEVTFKHLRERFLVLVTKNKPAALHILHNLGLAKLTAEALNPEWYAGILADVEKELAAHG